MANLGRQYLRLAERDFGYRPFDTFIYLPRRYKLSGQDLLPGNCVRYKLGFFPSTIGDVDYSTGKIVWEWTDTTFITPGAFVRLEFQLSFDAAWGKFTAIYGHSGTDIYQADSGATLSGFPVPNATQNLTWLVSPTPTCTRGLLGIATWRWSDGPPQL